MKGIKSHPSADGLNPFIGNDPMVEPACRQDIMPLA